MRMVLIQGEPIFTIGFRAVTAASPDFELVGDAVDARSGFRQVDEHTPDLVVMDVALRGMNGITATREIKSRAPDCQVLLLAAWPRERDAMDGLAAGAHGFVLKSERVDTLLYAMRAVASGGTYLAPQLRGCDPGRLETSRPGSPGPAGCLLYTLSSREREVLDLVLKGWRNRNIAQELCISIKTVDTHRTRINRKLCCRSSIELILFAADNGLLPLAPSSALGVLEGPSEDGSDHLVGFPSRP